MEDWFTIEAIDQDTFAISEYQHWEETHCYLICGSESAVLIDTGLGVANIKEVVDTLTKLPIQVITTHVHWDHIGSHRYFTNIAVHEKEQLWLSSGFPIPLAVVKHNLTKNPCSFPVNFSLDDYQIYQGLPQHILHDGDCIALGGRTLRVVHTPGHSPGHCCFYDMERKYLYAGDLIYKGCLDAFYPTTDPQLFCHSVKKIEQLDILRVLPAHHQLMIPVTLITQIKQAFQQLEEEGKLYQGAGIFPFQDVSIHL